MNARNQNSVNRRNFANLLRALRHENANDTSIYGAQISFELPETHPQAVAVEAALAEGWGAAYRLVVDRFHQNDTRGVCVRLF